MAHDGHADAGLTVADLLDRAAAELAAAEISESRLKAETLLARVVGCRRLELPLSRDRVVEPARCAAFRGLLRRLLDGEPLQYILGDVEFMGTLFAVDRRVLIPRPETEELVERVLRREELWRCSAVRLGDVGTGSGCIAVSLALALPSAEIVATDAAEDALELARDNAGRAGVADRIRFMRCDLLSALAADSLQAVVSNPPYVATGEWLRLPREIRDFEPRAALDGGEDGLSVISRLVPEAFRALKSEGWLFMETGENQAPEVAAQMERQGFRAVAVIKDLSGRDRIVEGEKP